MNSQRSNWLSQVFMLPRDCTYDFFKIQDFETIMFVHGHMWCRSRVYLQRIGRNLSLEDFKIIKSSQGIWLILNFLKTQFTEKIMFVLKSWFIWDKRWRLRLSFRTLMIVGSRLTRWFVSFKTFAWLGNGIYSACLFEMQLQN